MSLLTEKQSDKAQDHKGVPLHLLVDIGAAVRRVEAVGLEPEHLLPALLDLLADLIDASQMRLLLFDDQLQLQRHDIELAGRYGAP